jgi:dihydrofolate reductase
VTETTRTPIVTCDVTVSLDGFISGPEHLDQGFMRIMDWIHQAMAWRERYGFSGGDNVDADAMTTMFENTGAHVMGRSMFDLGEQPWGDSPPFHAPVFVVTHRPRDPLAKAGGTTFHFVTDGVARAIELAREAAGGKNVHISGGADIVRQAIDADLVDELRLHIAPVLLGAGMPLFGTLTKGPRNLELMKVGHSERAVHLTYRLPK